MFKKSQTTGTLLIQKKINKISALSGYFALIHEARKEQWQGRLAECQENKDFEAVSQLAHYGCGSLLQVQRLDRVL
jgi:hypothetical protein